VPGDVVAVGLRPVVGALVRADGIRVLLIDEVALSACPLPALLDGPAVVTARIVLPGWDPYVLAETAGVQWAPADGPAVPLAPGDPAPLLPGAQLIVGLDAYTYEPVASGQPVAIGAGSPDATRRRARGHRRRRRRLPDRSLFRPTD
jgi:hypothetical protein